MNKNIKTIIKLEISAGEATPAPPVGPALGQHGLNIQEFCTRFNDATQSQKGDIIPVEITVYQDRSFSLAFKQPPISSLLKKAIGVEKGATNSLKNKIGKINKDQLIEIAKRKMPDLNTDDLEAAVRMIIGTAKNMGIEIEK